MLKFCVLLLLAEQAAVYGIFFRINLPFLFNALWGSQQPNYVYFQQPTHVNRPHRVSEQHCAQHPHRVKDPHVPHHMRQSPSQPNRNLSQPIRNTAHLPMSSATNNPGASMRSPEQASIIPSRTSTQSTRSTDQKPSTDTDVRSGIPLQPLRTQPSRGPAPTYRRPLQPLRTQPFRQPGQPIQVPSRRVSESDGLLQVTPIPIPVAPADRSTTTLRSPMQSTAVPSQSLNTQPFRDAGQPINTPPRRVDELDELSQETVRSIPVVREGRTAFNATQRALKISETKCDQTHPVVGGEKAFPGEFEFMAALGWETISGIDYKCGGTLLSTEYVLTAAHCTSQWGRSPSVVKLGGGSLRNVTDGPIRRVERVILHPDYNEGSDYNDIALLKLARKTPPMKTGCIWTEENIPRTSARAIGYGTTAFAGPSSDDLLKVTLSLFSNDVCNRFYQPGPRIPNGTISSQICVGDPQGEKDTCQGDSGGPLFIEMGTSFPIIPYIIGITSIGLQCAGAAPSIYVRVSSYTTWIESVVWPNDL